MGGLFGVASKSDCVADLFYGTDYHSHLGTRRGGMVVKNGEGYTRFIHSITNDQFRSKFEPDLPRLRGNTGIGVISDYEDQPLIIRSHHGMYSIITVGRIFNIDELSEEVCKNRNTHFAELKENETRNVGYIQVVEPARKPVRPDSPFNAKIVVAGAVASLIVGVLLALVLEYVDRLRVFVPPDELPVEVSG